MSDITIQPAELNFSADTADIINQHLQKIFSNSLFESSEVLKRFLSFIVEQTLEGNSNQLKEYTIGVGVLRKSPSFKPQYDAIVRIHAGRLRRALHQYYKQEGQTETIRISIPKGSYVPYFAKITPGNNEQIIFDTSEEDTGTAIPAKQLIVAVIPFITFEKRKSDISFAEGMAAQLSIELGQLKDITVIAYDTMQRIDKKIMVIKNMSSAIDVDYIFTGDIQKEDNRCRINVRLINTKTNEQVWSRVFDRNLTTDKIFEIQDSVMEHIVREFKDFCSSVQEKLAASSSKAISWTALTPVNNSDSTIRKMIKKSLTA